MTAWSKKPKGACIGCKHAEWNTTKSGRLDSGGGGKCHFKIVEMPVVPDYVDTRDIQRHAERSAKYPHHIYNDWPMTCRARNT